MSRIWKNGDVEYSSGSAHIPGTNEYALLLIKGYRFGETNWFINKATILYNPREKSLGQFIQEQLLSSVAAFSNERIVSVFAETRRDDVPPGKSKKVDVKELLGLEAPVSNLLDITQGQGGRICCLIVKIHAGDNFLPNFILPTTMSKNAASRTISRDMTQRNQQQGAFDVLMRTARQRPELMSLLPTFTNDGREWDEDAIPVDLTPLRDFRGFERSRSRISDRIWQVKKEFKECCDHLDEYIAERLEKQEIPVHADRRRRFTTALVFNRCGLPKELLSSVLSYLLPSMPPAIDEPSSDAYLCEIRVHYLPDSCESSYFPPPYVNGLVLIYSDGVMVKTGNLRGTYCPSPFIFQLHEHLIGVEEYKEFNYKLGEKVTTSLTFYTQCENGDCWRTCVKPEDIFRYNDNGFAPLPPDEPIRVMENQVVRSMTWCTVKHGICGYRTHGKPTHQYEAGYRYYEAERGRVAGFSPGRYHDEFNTMFGPLFPVPFIEYHQGEELVQRNLIPRQIMGKVWDVCSWDTISDFKHNFTYCWLYGDLQAKVEHAMYCSNEAHNICTLTKMICKTKDKVKRRKLQKELKRQYKALDKRVGLICEQIDRLANLSAWKIQYENCYVSISKANPRVNEQLRDILEQEEVPSEKKGLLVCAWCPGNKVFDPRLIPSWQRCVHPGCCDSVEIPCCRKHISNCKMCFEPLCHYHRKHSGAHKRECEKTLSRRCGWRGNNWRDEKPRMLDNRRCGKLLSSSEGEMGNENRCGKCNVLCCTDCITSCRGWYPKCRCKPRCHVIGDAKCKLIGKAECASRTVWCKSCVIENASDDDKEKDKGMTFVCGKCSDEEHEDYIEDTDEDEEISDYMEDTDDIEEASSSEEDLDI